VRSHVLAALAIFPLCLVAQGCMPSHAQYSGLTSGLIGCAPEQIQIANDKLMSTVVTWEAVCSGRKFYCSAAGQLASCKESVSTATAGTEAAPATSETAASPAP
jgi:hypothetical protein